MAAGWWFFEKIGTGYPEPKACSRIRGTGSSLLSSQVEEDTGNKYLKGETNW